MRILTRYVLMDLLKVFFLTLGVMTLLLFVVLLGRQAVDRGLGLGPLLKMAPYILPEAMQFTLPGALLLATTGVYGRIAASNEIVAIKSLGISPLSLVWPTLVLAVLVSFTAVMLNDIAVSWGRLGQERVFLESMEAVAYGQLRNRGTFSVGDVSVKIRGVEDRTLIGPTVIRQGKGDKPTTIVTAESAQFTAYPHKGELVLRLRNWEVVGPLAVVWPGEREEVIPLDEFLGTKNRTRSPSTYALAEIGPAKAEQSEKISQIRQERTTRAAYAMLTGSFDELGDDAWQPQERALHGAENRLHRFHTEPYRRWASGFSCLAFAVIGIPVAVIFRKGEFLASFFICFLPILLVYYPLLMFSISGAKNGSLPPQLLWIGNLVLLVIGAWLMRRVVRY
ncbi:MAG: LptF/LptG family permease [Aeoliella sp.]